MTDNLKFKDWQCHDDGPPICREEAVKRTLAFSGIHDIAPEAEIGLDFVSTGEDGAPDTVGTLLLWYRSDTFLALEDGDPIGAWPDLSGNGWNATQSTANKQPLFKIGILGKPALQFDGANDDMAIAAGLDAADRIPFTIMIAVYQPVNLKGLFDSAPSLGDTFRFWQDNEVEIHDNDPAISIEGVAGGCVITVTAEYDAGNRKLTSHRSTTQIDQDTGGTDPALFSSARIGSINTATYFSGYILELALWNTALSTEDRETVIAYMEVRYGL